MRTPFLLVAGVCVAMSFGCNRAAVESSPEEFLAFVQTEPQPSSALERIGVSLAAALRNADTRAWLLQSIDASTYVEGRIPLKRLLVQDSSPVLRSVVQSAITAGERSATIASLPELELYLPIRSHLQSARNGGGLQVAVRTAADGYYVVRPDGTAFEVGEWYDPGDYATVVLAKSEIDYDDIGSAISGGERTGSGILKAMGEQGIGGVALYRQLSAFVPVAPHAECDPEVQNCGGGGPQPPPPVGGDMSHATYMATFYLVMV